MMRDRPLLRLSQFLFSLLIVSLPLMKLGVGMGGYLVTATDGLFLLCAAAFAGAVVRGEAVVGWSGLHLALLAYFAALALSALGSDDPAASVAKLVTQLYLIALPVLASSLVTDMTVLRTMLTRWLAATAVPAVIGLVTLAAFGAGVDRDRLDYGLHPFGTLPPGNYPRLETTFFFPSMLCNYLTVSAIVLLACRHAGWVGRATFYSLLAASLLTAAFTLTPGLGALLFAIAWWAHLQSRSRESAVALFLGAGAVVASVLVSAVTPIAHPTAPFSIQVPLLGLELAPAVRWMTWSDAALSFAQHPLLGTGIGVPAISVEYVDPSGDLHHLTDAHNVFLNIAAQAGVIGLAGLLVLIGWVSRHVSRLWGPSAPPLPLALGIAWLSAFAIEGLTSSFEDARHLWVLLGLFAASLRLQAVGEDHGNAARSGATNDLRASTENSRSGL